VNSSDTLIVHLAWKHRLRGYLEGVSGETLDPEVVAREDCCELGHWIASRCDALSAVPEFIQMREQHAAFHRCAGNIVRCKPDGAEYLLTTEYARLSARVVYAITRLSHVLEKAEYS